MVIKTALNEILFYGVINTHCPSFFMNYIFIHLSHEDYYY